MRCKLRVHKTNNMANLTSLTDLYDFEGIVERAAAEVLTSAGIVAYTPAIPMAKRALPRVEVMFSVGSEQGHMVLLTDGTQRADRWRGSLVAQCVARTEAEVRSLRAKLRDVTAAWRGALNAAMENHNFDEILDAGSSPLVSVDGGYLASTLRFSVVLSVAPAAWILYEQL